MKSSSQAGYTIIELLVVFAIISVIMMITLFQYATFSSSTVLTNLTYEVALSIRQAQVYGLSVKGTTGGAAAPLSSATYNAGYGIHLDAVHPSGNLITSMVLFTDLPLPGDTRPTGDRTFNYSDPPTGTGPAGSPEFLEQVSVPGGYLIQKFCGFYGATGTAYRCSDGTSSDGAGGITGMDIVFQRPNPGAFFRDLPLGNTAYSRVEITIYSLRNTSLSRKAVVESTGQISVR